MVSAIPPSRSILCHTLNKEYTHTRHECKVCANGNSSRQTRIYFLQLGRYRFNSKTRQLFARLDQIYFYGRRIPKIKATLVSIISFTQWLSMKHTLWKTARLEGADEGSYSELRFQTTLMIGETACATLVIPRFWGFQWISRAILAWFLVETISAVLFSAQREWKTVTEKV